MPGRLPGFGAIGTPDMVRAQVDRLWNPSAGGFGSYLMLAHNWANFDATRKSYDLIARYMKAVEAAGQRCADEVAQRGSVH